MSEAERVISGSLDSVSGKLRVSAAVTFGRLHLMPLIKQFLKRYPELSIGLELDDRDIDVLQEGIDVALRMGTLTDSNMFARRIATSPRIVVATPGYLAAAGIPTSPADLSRHEVVVYSRRGGGDSWSFKKGDTVSTISVSGRIRSGAAEGVRAAVLEDMGIAIASRWMFAREVASGRVQTILTEWQLPAIDLWAVFPSRRFLSASARAFITFVEQSLV
jgi:DNA-binding transcriptional LysR family regulator